MLTTVKGLDLLSAMPDICCLPFSGEETGMPLGKYIDDLVFLRAKQLLMDRSVPIGQTPTEFREDAVVTRT